MEGAAISSPKDEHILNKDDSITNKDGDSYLEKGEQPIDQNKIDQKRVPIVAPDNEEPGPPPEEKPPKKGNETKKYAL